MKGFALGALVLIALDVVLSAPASRIPGAIAPVTGWLTNWLDPTVPLIGPGQTPPSSTATGPPPPANATVPSTTKVRPQNGVCPTGWPLVNGWCHAPTALVTPR